MRVTVLGGAAWNRMIHVERLPDGRSATIHPLRHHEAIGGAGAGKAMNLARLGVAVTLHAGIGDDEAGRHVRTGLQAAGVDLRATTDQTGTAQHVNLMDPAGGRISVMLANGSPELPFNESGLADSMADADVVVVDLAPWTPRAIALARASGRPIWTDLHDHDGAKEWHAPFIGAADVVFVSHGRLASPTRFLESLIDRGKRLAVCTMAADGAIALDAERQAYHVPAMPDVEIVDTNGAGDAFFAGVLFGVLSSVGLERALRYGAIAGGLAVASPDLASADLTPERLRAGGDA
jgi:acarbose 7IV-phosphotransferase